MDARVSQILHEHWRHDKSFTEKPTILESLLGGIAYTQRQARDIWYRGIRVGIELGLRKAALEGQKIELLKNTQDPRHTEFLDKFYALAAEYQCGIQHHPEHGMIVIDTLKRRP